MAYGWEVYWCPYSVRTKPMVKARAPYDPEAVQMLISVHWADQIGSGVSEGLA